MIVLLETIALTSLRKAMSWQRLPLSCEFYSVVYFQCYVVVFKNYIHLTLQEISSLKTFGKFDLDIDAFL